MVLLAMLVSCHDIGQINRRQTPSATSFMLGLVTMPYICVPKLTMKEPRAAYRAVETSLPMLSSVTSYVQNLKMRVKGELYTSAPTQFSIAYSVISVRLKNHRDVIYEK